MLTQDKHKRLKMSASHLRKANEVLQVRTAKIAATKATKAAAASSARATKIASLAAHTAAHAAEASATATEAAANAALLAQAADSAFHRADDAAATLEVDQATKWALETTGYADLAALAAKRAGKAASSIDTQ
jgi:hypothetical protein